MGCTTSCFVSALFILSLSRALIQITRSRPGRVEDFLRILQTKVDEKLETPPDKSRP